MGHLFWLSEAAQGRKDQWAGLLLQQPGRGQFVERDGDMLRGRGLEPLALLFRASGLVLKSDAASSTAASRFARKASRSWMPSMNGVRHAA